MAIPVTTVTYSKRLPHGKRSAARPRHTRKSRWTAAVSQTIICVIPPHLSARRNFALSASTWKVFGRSASVIDPEAIPETSFLSSSGTSVPSMTSPPTAAPTATFCFVDAFLASPRMRERSRRASVADRSMP